MHLRADTAKDVRWFSFYDFAVALDKCWHSEAMAHCFSLFVEGKNPWGLNRSGDVSEDNFSARVAAWHVRSPVVADFCRISYNRPFFLES